MNSLVTLDTKIRSRTVFISDVHLGFPGCSAEFLCDFLDKVECETLYLVGDIFDFWYMKRRRYWPKAHGEVVHRLMKKARHGTRVVFVPGNHDEVCRAYDGMDMGCIEIHDRIIHETADGRKMLVLHGDQFDSVVRCSPWLAKIGCVAYGALLQLNILLNGMRRVFGMGYWSLAAFLKNKVKNAVKYISSFEEAVVRAASEDGVDGVVCGHIHRAEITQVNDILYMNCGDWVESCTALVEKHDGSIELLQWRDRAERLKVHAADPVEAGDDMVGDLAA
ncbi:UDP-2,3-diacylglucosamine diphosphatase [Marinihelvus fidelis]|uniref:UDP-2,3-diacylglucosamine diphosphatase n=1 Tax=Marinihelvus fidelis TaxID=2613842 RepID=A0A5N0T951_9GAMM|nr:UDP-2,3-diacylglucosamine diphosphatase [Marinihelvus fidelis]KAA9130306.1 UDP-2,3-diacylglucosamine diphosphatase [Marinihelvus fidelis]